MTTADDAAEQWLVVGGKGKPRKGGGGVRSANQHQTQQQPQKSIGICTAAAAASSPLPGWEEPTTATAAAAANGSSDSGFTYGNTTSSGRKGSRRHQQLSSSSIEQQVHRLQQQVLEIARELRQSAVYQALLAAMQQVVATAATGGADSPQQQQQQQQQLELETTQSTQQQQQQWEWPGVQQLVVYGLGSVEDSRVSRHQLAMVVLLQELLPGLQHPPQLFDPAFSPLDTQLLQQLGMAVIGRNEEGRRSIGGQRTLFFLPHCEGVLCDNLLAANWSPSALSQLAILGNSFSTYRERWSGALKPKTVRPDKLLQLVEHGVVREVAVPDRQYPVPSAFNDMALHTFEFAGATAGAAAALGGLFEGV